MLLSAAHTGTHSIELERNFSSEMFASLIISNQVPYGVKLSDTKKKRNPGISDSSNCSEKETL